MNAAHPSPVVDEMIVVHSQEIGSKRRTIGNGEIVERLVYALANEGARILAEGIASKAPDIDVVYLNGYGFPAFAAVRCSMRIRSRSQTNGDAWTLAPLITEMA